MLSILIVHWNTSGMLRKCLESIQRFPFHDEYEVIVVDNASSDNAAQLVASDFPSVRLIASERNLGYAAGNNAAFAAASGEWLLTLNPDTEMTEGALDAAVSSLKANPTMGALGAKLMDADGSVQASIRGFPGALGILGDLTGLSRLFPKSKFGSYRLPAFDYESAGPAPQPMGTFLLFRRDALAAVGSIDKPFDESFPIFFNEVDLLYRLDRAGWGCCYDPEVRIVHLGGASTRQVRKPMIWESHRSLARFLNKHYRTPWNALGLAILTGVIWLGAWIRARGYDVGFRG